MTSTETPQFTRDQVQNLTPTEMVAARTAGQLDALLGRLPESHESTDVDTEPRTPGVPRGAMPGPLPGAQLRRSDLRTMTPDAIVQAKAEGLCERMIVEADW